jgi:ATP-binding cassette subfamily B protein RaxB
MIASFHGYRIDIKTISRRHPVSWKNVTLHGPIQVVYYIYMACRPVRFTLHDTRPLVCPTIVRRDMNRFVVPKAVGSCDGGVTDPAPKVKAYPLPDASKHLPGVELALPPAKQTVLESRR